MAGSLVFLSLWVSKIITGLDQPRLVTLFHVIFYVTVQNRLIKTGVLSPNQLILCIADLLIASEGILNKNNYELSGLTHCTTCGKLVKMYTLQSHKRNHTKGQFSDTLVYQFSTLENKITLGLC